SPWRPPPQSTLFPYTTLFRSLHLRQITIVGTGLIGGSLGLALRKNGFRGKIVGCDRKAVLARAKRMGAITAGIVDPVEAYRGDGDRKSTRLNSSHVEISYGVF